MAPAPACVQRTGQHLGMDRTALCAEQLCLRSQLPAFPLALTEVLVGGRKRPGAAEDWESMGHCILESFPTSPGPRLLRPGFRAKLKNLVLK